MTKRYFASESPDDPDYETMREWSPDELESRPGMGDELEYDELRDSFGYAEGSGISPLIWVRNPFPGDLIRGAIEVSKIADRAWES